MCVHARQPRQSNKLSRGSTRYGNKMGAHRLRLASQVKTEVVGMALVLALSIQWASVLTNDCGGTSTQAGRAGGSHGNERCASTAGQAEPSWAVCIQGRGEAVLATRNKDAFHPAKATTITAVTAVGTIGMRILTSGAALYAAGRAEDGQP